ncbi:MAG TPA: transcription termination/antitermination NusG family protein [Ginsengibacter sp.]|nr:transcription termination/antitermination NusG family protein [Ginsengibacter sp.]
MQKNWYVLYTKPHCELKASGSLSKLKVENFCPHVTRKSQSFRRIRLKSEPLFPSYVFVRVTDSEILSLTKKVDNVLNVVYYGSRPAIISDDEIDAIKDFTSNHLEISLEKCHIDSYFKGSILGDNLYQMDGKIWIIKNRVVKVNLPSLGYTMVAHTEDTGRWSRELLLDKVVVDSTIRG